jgi:hypothetical protein
MRPTTTQAPQGRGRGWKCAPPRLKLLTDGAGGGNATSAQIEEWGEQGRRQVEAANALQHSIEQVTACVWSPGREVCVTVDHSGQLRDIIFSERAERTSTLRLSGIVTTTIRRALAELQSTVVVQVARDAAGEGSPLALSVENQYRSAFGSPLAALAEQDRRNGH